MTDEDKLIRPPEDTISDEDRKLIELYHRAGVPVDQLPYTDEFEELFANYQAQQGVADTKECRHDLLRRLLRLRKKGKLPRFKAATGRPAAERF